MRGEDRINADRATNTNKPRELLLCEPYDMCGVGRIETSFQQRVKKVLHSEKFWPLRKDKSRSTLSGACSQKLSSTFFCTSTLCIRGATANTLKCIQMLRQHEVHTCICSAGEAESNSFHRV